MHHLPFKTCLVITGMIHGGLNIYEYEKTKLYKNINDYLRSYYAWDFIDSITIFKDENKKAAIGSALKFNDVGLENEVHLITQDPYDISSDVDGNTENIIGKDYFKDIIKNNQRSGVGTVEHNSKKQLMVYSKLAKSSSMIVGFLPYSELYSTSDRNHMPRSLIRHRKCFNIKV